MIQQYWLYLIYLLGSVFFIVGLKMLSGPKTARNGNFLAAAGMTLAILGTIFMHTNEDGEPSATTAGFLAVSPSVRSLAGFRPKK